MAVERDKDEWKNIAMADYSTYSKEELLKLIAKQEKELKAKKYGLVWDSEREPEQVVLDCENFQVLIILRLKQSRKIFLMYISSL